MKQHKSIHSKTSSGATNTISFGSSGAELILEESVNVSKVLGNHKAGEAVSNMDRGSRTPEIKP